MTQNDKIAKYLQVGEIVNTHGVNGEVKVIPLTDDPARFKNLDWVYLDKQTSMEKVKISNVKYLKGFVILKFKEIDDMSSAEALKGLFIKIDRENAVALPEDSFFICDLIECEVFEVEGKRLGVLSEVIQTGSNDVFVVKNEGRKDILIPALKSVIKEVSLENRRIKVLLPKGLINDEI